MTTNIQTFSGNVGIGTNDPDGFKLNVNGTVSATSLTVGGISNSQVPSGLIAMWSGALDDLPTGWKICDGNDGTPNLANKFILGSEEHNGGDPTVNQEGGDHSPNITANQLPIHTHSIGTQANHAHGTNSAGSHQHYCKGAYGKEFGVRGGNTQNNLYSRQGIIVVGGTAWGNNSNIINNQVRAGNTGGHTHSVNGGGEHNHGGDTGNNTTNADTFDNRPAYFVLAFIMKI